MKRIISVILTLLIVISCISAMGMINVNATQNRKQNFSRNFTITGNGAEDTVNVAQAQLGKTGSQLGYSEQWCADFISDCAILANQSSAIPASGYCPTLRQNIINAGGYYVNKNSAKKGDIVFYGNNGADHVEIVYAASNGNVSTYGGNSGSGGNLYARSVRQHPTQTQSIAYIVRPNYQGNGCNCSTDYAGEYYVSTSSQPLILRSGHGTGYTELAQIPKDTVVYVSKANGEWAHVNWNGYNGYCSMQYLKRVEERNKSFKLHVWVSDTDMGDVPGKFSTGNRYYICYEIIDETTGKKANDSNNLSYTATETIRNSSGTVFEYSYTNSDNNWISSICEVEDTYIGTVTITGDINMSCTVSFDAYTETSPAIKIWAWDDDVDNNISDFSLGKTTYISYNVIDKKTNKSMNSVSKIWLTQGGYKVTISDYDPNGTLVTSKYFKDNDNASINFVPNKEGKYTVTTQITGTLSGTINDSYNAIENEHSFGNWSVVKEATCTEQGLQKRTCTICGESQTQVINAKGHSYNNWSVEKAATCTESGIEYRKCISCGYKETRTISAKGHVYVDTVIAPTATEKGYTLHKCSVCGNSYKDNYKDPVNQNAPQIVMQNRSVRAGDKITIDVLIKNNPGVWGMDLTVSYDSSMLTLTNVVNGKVFSASEWTKSVINNNKYILSYEASGFDNVNTNGVLATLEFTVNENAKVGSSSEIKTTYNKGDIINSNFEDLNFNTISSKIDIINFIYGDINGDGLINKKDSLLLKMYLADNTIKIDKKAADVYADGSINKKDSLRLKQYLAGLDVKLGE